MNLQVSPPITRGIQVSAIMIPEGFPVGTEVINDKRKKVGKNQKEP